jgi:hypothetical protein
MSKKTVLAVAFILVIMIICLFSWQSDLFVSANPDKYSYDEPNSVAMLSPISGGTFWRDNSSSVIPVEVWVYGLGYDVYASSEGLEKAVWLNYSVDSDAPVSMSIGDLIGYAPSSQYAYGNITDLSDGNHTIQFSGETNWSYKALDGPLHLSTYFILNETRFRPVYTSFPSSTPSSTPLSTPTLAPTIEPTAEPSSTPKTPSGFLGTNLPMQYGYAVVAVLVIIVVAGLSLAYLKRHNSHSPKN